MQTRTVDVAIIGAGTAGLSARREVERRGRSFALVERGPHGTTCARIGCMPSKLLIAAADQADEVRRAGQFGIRVPDGVTIDGPAVLERVRTERDRFVGHVLEAVEDIPPEQRVSGSARFVAPTTIEVDDHTRIEARTIIVATGSSPWVPPTLDGVRDHVLVNDDVFDLEDLPGSIAVFGTGIIGIELGQALHRLGTRVAFFNPFAVVGPLTDPAVRREVLRVFGEELQMHLGIRDERVEPHPDGGVVVTWRDAEGDHSQRFDKVLAAAGRRPNLTELDLEAAGMTCDPRGMPRIDRQTMQVADRPIFFAGDVTADRPLLHEAADEGRIAGANAAMWPEIRGHVRKTPLAIVFTDPQIAVVGSHFEKLRGSDIVMGEVSYANQGRARVMARNAGLVRVYAAREDGRLLGAEMFGPRVEHTAHLLAWAIETRLSVDRILQMPVYHPVVEEGIRRAIRDAARQLRLAPTPRPHDMDCGPGT